VLAETVTVPVRAIVATTIKRLAEEHTIQKLLVPYPDANILFVLVGYTPAIVVNVQPVTDAPVMLTDLI
jgi:hypothetical protein